MTDLLTPPRRARASSPALVLAASCACTVLVVGFVAAINLAVPRLAAGSLHPSSAALLWIVDSYVLCFACLVVVGGAAGDRFGRKGVLLAGLGLFAAGALLSGLAWDVPALLAGRAITGLGAAAVLPNSLAVLLHATPPQRRRAAIAVWASMTGLGGVAGNVGGALALQAGSGPQSWRTLFLVVAPIALGCAAWIGVGVPRSTRVRRALRPQAAALLTVASVALLLGVIEGPQHGWASGLVLGAFAAAVALFAAWTVVELRAAEPLLDPRLFRIGALRNSCIGMLVAFFGMFALFYVNASFLQYGKGYSVLRTGLAIIPMTVPMLLGARYVPRLVTRFGGARTLAAAFALIGGGLLCLAGCDGSTPYPVYAGWLVVIGVGCALALPALSADITQALPPEQAGVGSGLQATTREFGSALGVAVIGTVVASRFSDAIPGHPRSVAVALRAAHGAAGRQDVAHAYVAAAQTGWQVIGVVTLVIGAGVALALRDRR